MRILLIEDDPELADFLLESLKELSYAVDLAKDGEKGFYLAKINNYDLVILDFGLPKKNGLEVCKELRAMGRSMPIIMVSVITEMPAKIAILDAGADDYITKPFAIEELTSRIKAILRRGSNVSTPVLSIDDLSLDVDKQIVYRADERIYLTKKEFALLEYLLINKGRLLSRSIILEHVWNMEGDPFSNTVEAHILNLRRKIERKDKNKLIHNIPGRGYKIDIAI